VTSDAVPPRIVHASRKERMSEQEKKNNSGAQPTAPSQADASEKDVSPAKEMPRPIAGGYIDRFSARLRQALHRTRR